VGPTDAASVVWAQGWGFGLGVKALKLAFGGDIRLYFILNPRFVVTVFMVHKAQ
jgi:hypothetical protein